MNTSRIIPVRPPDVDFLAEIAKKSAELGTLITDMRHTKELDQRWVNIGATDLQTGLMALNRAVLQPTTF